MTGKRNKKELEKMLNFDALAEAEDIFGRGSKASQAFGLSSFLENNKKKADLLDSLGDSKFSNKIEDYIKIIKSIGFEEIYREKLFKHESNETLYVYWLDELGIILYFDTYYGNINGSNFYYNWFIPFKIKNRHQHTSSGCFMMEKGNNLVYFDVNGNRLDVKEKRRDYPNKLSKEDKEFNDKLHDTCYGVYIGNHDGREAIKHKISGLKNNGKLLTQWIDPDQCFSITTSEDYKNNIHEEKSIERISKFPEHIKKKICFDQIKKNTRL